MIDELIESLGIKEEAPVENFKDFLRSEKTKECIKAIAFYLGLSIEINLSYVSKNYKLSGDSKFESRHLAKTDYAGRGIEGISAQIAIPNNLPLFGTSGLKSFPIDVRISENFKEYPETFIAVMAHELSHIVLHSLWHKEKDNEFCTDLTAMILGFLKIIRNGRRVSETTFGYLSDEQFNFAFNKINEVLKKHAASKKKFSNKLEIYKKLIFSYRKNLFKFNRFFEYLDKNRDKRIGKEDVHKIIVFHKVDYIDNLRAFLKSNENRFKELNRFYGKLSHYTQRKLSLLKQFDKEIQDLTVDLQKKHNLLKKHVNILSRYVGLFYRLKIWLDLEEQNDEQ